LPAGGTGRGFVFTKALPSGEAVYEVILGPFSAQCGDAPSGFVRVPGSQPFHSTTWLVPIIGIIGPD
jgi:hypothetical protein